LEEVLGKEVGQMYLNLHEGAGVKVHTKKRLTKVNVDKKNVMESIVLDDGTTLEADMVIMATGADPATF
jgi:NAD(P)H-nitrite reductase large subunit